MYSTVQYKEEKEDHQVQYSKVQKGKGGPPGTVQYSTRRRSRTTRYSIVQYKEEKEDHQVQYSTVQGGEGGPPGTVQYST